MNDKSKSNKWVPIRKMNRTQCERLSKILEITNGDKFMNAFKEAFAGTTITLAYTTYSHRKKHMSDVRDRMKVLNAENAQVKTPIRIQKVIPAPRGTPDAETLLTAILNESRAQTSILSKIANCK